MAKPEFLNVFGPQNVATSGTALQQVGESLKCAFILGRGTESTSAAAVMEFMCCSVAARNEVNDAT